MKRDRRLRVAVAAACALHTRLLLAQSPPPQVIFFNGNIHTLDPSHPRAEAIGIADGRIVAVGSNAEVRGRAQPATRIEDLRGRTVLPGLIDAHCHVAGLGSFGLGRLNFGDAKSFDDVIGRIAARARSLPKGAWIVGGLWNHESWPGRELPSHDALSAVTPHHPVWIKRVDGHAGLANARAMKAAGISHDSSAPFGGEIVRDAAGAATGLFVDNAEALIERHLPAEASSPATLILKAQQMCLSVGLTGVHDAGITPDDVDVYRELAESGKLKLRVYAMISARHAVDYFKEHGPLIGERITVRSCKLYADGSLGSRGAWLLEPYSDRPRDESGKPYVGLSVSEPDFLRQIAEDALQRGYQMCTHAIGDRANRETIDAYALALSRHPRKDHRFRIEHVQLLALDDIPRFKEHGIIPSMQPTHCTSDMGWIEERVGARRSRGAYAWAKLLRSGVPIAGGSDFPVESHNPFYGIYAAVTRQNVKGEPEGGWHPEERMTRTEALRAFTLDAAYAAFEEKQKGSLAPGKFADFIVIDRDIMTCDVREIPQTRVLRTVIGGETVYTAR